MRPTLAFGVEICSATVVKVREPWTTKLWPMLPCTVTVNVTWILPAVSTRLACYRCRLLAPSFPSTLFASSNASFSMKATYPATLLASSDLSDHAFVDITYCHLNGLVSNPQQLRPS